MSAVDDELWLTKVHPMATIAEIEAFCERVAIKVAEGYSEATARYQAYTEQYDV